jgi:hypothetical protein
MGTPDTCFFAVNAPERRRRLVVERIDELAASLRNGHGVALRGRGHRGLPDHLRCV